jgi:opacity protein-like surface antigen
MARRSRPGIKRVRARVGYAWDRLLVYGTGGFAYGQVNSSASAAVGAGGGGGAIFTSQNSGPRRLDGRNHQESYREDGVSLRQSGDAHCIQSNPFGCSWGQRRGKDDR